MSKVKFKNNEKPDENDETPSVPETETTTHNPEPTTNYGVGGVYRSIGGGKRVKV